MDYLISRCNKLQYLDISTFTTIKETVSLLSGLSNSGKIVIKKEFYNKISGKIPLNLENLFK
jgi:hypothetical protein